MIGITLLTVPTVAYGGTFVLQLLTGTIGVETVGMQRVFFRAGHGHAGVLLLLALITQTLSDSARLAPLFRWTVLVGSALVPLLVSGGFFFSVLNEAGTPSGLISLAFAGAIVLGVVMITLAVGLFRRPEEL
jgi:hypothetical protein